MSITKSYFSFLFRKTLTCIDCKKSSVFYIPSSDIKVYPSKPFYSLFRQQEVKTIESTELYKRQYEQLLQEYNQYLEDLESVQSKLKGLETLKSTYEEENASLRELSQRYQSKAESLQEQVLLLLISAITFV